MAITFEIHITGNHTIMQAGRSLGIKTIAVELMRPDRSVIRTEYMTSDVVKFNSCMDAAIYLGYVENTLHRLGVQIFREKIECPFIPEFVDRSYYVESHFYTEDNKYPISRNKNKTKILGTAREYDKAEFHKFNEKWKHEIVELCLYDTDIKEDYDWLSLWSK